MKDVQNIGGLRPEYKTYERQKCFVGHSHEAEWRDDILSACADVLPKFGLEPWYAADHFDPTKPLRDKVVELIANARYGIYDLSSWQDKSGKWHLPRNVFIELGMAIALNRPALLLRHTSNTVLPLPPCLQGVELLEFAGETTLKKALEERLPQWFDIPPDRNWLNRFCIFGNRVCGFREEHPRARQWRHETLRCHVSDGLDKDRPGFQTAEREEIRAAFEDIFDRYNDLEFDYLDELSPIDGYQFILCSHCQTVRSTPLAVYRILPHTPAEVFIAIGMSIALETLFEYDIPQVLLVRQEQDLPSLLRGYEVMEAVNSSKVKRKLRAFIPAVMQKVRETVWKPKPLPFTEFTIQPDIEFVEEAALSQPRAEPGEIGKATILFADNDPNFLAVRKEFLEAADYKVVTATSPSEGRNILQEGRIDLAILDLRLTDDRDERDISGLRLAQDAAFRDIPKIIISAFPTADAVREALISAANEPPLAQDFIAKQDGPEAMLQAVNRLVDEQVDTLRFSLFSLLADFESALRELVDQALQMRYGREWPTRLQVGRESNRLTLSELLRLVREQRDVFEPLFTTPNAYGTLVTTAREITTTRNALAHARPLDAAGMRPVQELVDNLLLAVREARERAESAGNIALEQKVDAQSNRSELSPEELVLLRVFGETHRREIRPLDAEKWSELAQRMRDCFNELSDRERAILEMRFGFTDGEQRTFREIGQEFGVTGERIRQIEARALSRLRHPNVARELRGYRDDLIPESESGDSQAGSQTLVATLGLTVEEVLASEQLPPDAPADYPSLCDWLEEDLRKRLQDSIGDEFRYPEASKRDGEILSVRIAFPWQQQDKEPDFGGLGWWSLLELASLEEVYPGQDATNLWAS